MSAPDESADSELCVVCCKTVDIYSVGTCDHPVCFECSTRMRVLCDQKECPICRGLMPKVIFSEEIDTFQSLFRRYQRTDLQDRKHGLIFASADIQRRYQEFLEYRCTTCGDSGHKNVFPTFHELRDHVRRKHDLLFCELCVRNLKIFCFERRCYTRQELGRHRRKGDPDNTSHRGHPLCEFCDTRFVDSDELFRHLRRDHLFCHFCDADGKHQYYNSLPDLIEHFKDEHFLCEEGDCRNMPLAAVFRTDIDLKAHIATEHGRFLSKQGAKQARTLEVEFTLAPRPRPDRNKRPVERQLLPTPDWSEEGAIGYESEPSAPVKQTPLTLQDFPALGNSVQPRPLSAINYTQKVNSTLRDTDFPSLGGSRSAGVSITTNPSSRKPDVTITRTLGGPRPNFSENFTKSSENFPRLGAPSTTAATSTVHVSLNNNGQTSTPKVSIHVSHNSASGVTSTRIRATPSATSSGDFNVHQKPVEAFPALGGSMKPMQPKWVQQKPKKTESKLAKVAPAPKLPPSDLSQFPTLSKPKNDKKSSSVTVPVTQSWTSASSTSKTSINNITNNNKSGKGDVSSSNNVDSIEGTKSNKAKIKKKKNNNNNNVELYEIGKTAEKNKSNNSEVEKNGIVKKRSELKIGSLTLVENSKPPPGFPTKPPPGLSQNFPKLTNDLTFTNSSGQSYTINPSNYHQPKNFTQRNQNLIKRFMDALDNEMIKEFKSYSALFREGNLPAARYYEHCKSVLGQYFEEVFPELLVLLPDIEKQQELFREYSCEGKSRLLVCENCKQVIFKRELTEHYNLHSLDSHFPTLFSGPGAGSNSNNNANAWKK